MVLPFTPAAAPGFQKTTDASLHGALVAENPLANAHEPISFNPNACARATVGARASDARTARYGGRRCRCISILQLFRPRRNAAPNAGAQRADNPAVMNSGRFG